MLWAVAQLEKWAGPEDQAERLIAIADVFGNEPRTQEYIASMLADQAAENSASAMGVIPIEEGSSPPSSPKRKMRGFREFHGSKVKHSRRLYSDEQLEEGEELTMRGNDAWAVSQCQHYNKWLTWCSSVPPFTGGSFFCIMLSGLDGGWRSQPLPLVLSVVVTDTLTKGGWDSNMPRPFDAIPHGVECVLNAHATAIMSAAKMGFVFTATAALPSDGDLDAVNAFMQNWLTTNFKNVPAGNITYDNFTIKSLAEHNGPEKTYPTTQESDNTNGRFAVFAPETLTKSGLSGRSFNGRNYMFLPADDDLGDLGEFDPGMLADLQSAMDALIVAAAAATYPWAVPSFKLHLLTPIETTIVQEQYAYQTRRDIHRG